MIKHSKEYAQYGRGKFPVRGKRSSKNTIFVDDRVRIVNPIIVERVGYPLTRQMVYEELNIAENRQRVIEMLQDFNVSTRYDRYSPWTQTTPDSLVQRILYEVAFETVSMRDFGGNERTLHVREVPEIKDKIVSIIDKKTVRTGQRYEASGYGEDSEPAGLTDAKSHVLLAFHPSDTGHCMPQNVIWIEKTHVELLK